MPPSTAPALQRLHLPRPAPARVLACGAFLKNTACLLEGDTLWWSPLHDDLSTPEACRALDASLQALVAQAAGPIAAVAHDLHPDFHSTRLALGWAQQLGVPAIGVQHHHAHLAVLQAEQGWDDAEGPPLVGLMLDGVGLGTDGQAWGGELLLARGATWRRLGHLRPLALPGGDIAAREPWRLAAAVLHAAGRPERIASRFAPQVGEASARGLALLLARDLNCPRSTSAGRWFDAAAGALGLSLRQAQEAEAAVALERAATDWLARHPAPALPDEPSLDLLPLVLGLFDEADAGRGAARFHLALAEALVQAAAEAAQAHDAAAVLLGGGCFYNRLLTNHVTLGLQARGLAVHRPEPGGPARGPGDAGLALGQAWAAALQLQQQAERGQPRPDTHPVLA